MQPILVLENRLDQLIDVIDQLNDEQYSRALTILHDASIGGHVRHIIEFFQCLLEQYPQGKVNYDLRKRNLLFEESVMKAIEEIKNIRVLCGTITADTSMTLEADLSISSEDTALIPTSLMRELVYQLEHTVHHMALIKIALTHSFETVTVPKEFGVAESTLRNRILLRS